MSLGSIVIRKLFKDIMRLIGLYCADSILPLSDRRIHVALQPHQSFFRRIQPPLPPRIRFRNHQQCAIPKSAEAHTRAIVSDPTSVVPCADTTIKRVRVTGSSMSFTIVDAMSSATRESANQLRHRTMSQLRSWPACA